jgi:hypothetical protein
MNLTNSILRKQQMNSIELNGTGVLSHRLNALTTQETKRNGYGCELQSENLIKINYKNLANT